MGRPHSGVRWRDDGWELRCPACAKAGGEASYWPLTDEFWDRKSGMTRCRACHLAARRRSDSRRWRTNPAYRAKKIADQQRYRDETRDAAAIKRRARYAENQERERQNLRDRYQRDPELHRANQRLYYWANRDAILAKRRVREKAA